VDECRGQRGLQSGITNGIRFCFILQKFILADEVEFSIDKF
jgi:hypothetical protein